jgi:hypothetical protein
MRHPLLRAVLITTGFILSPLSWWNDMIINIPLAYVLAAPFDFFVPDLFPAAFVICYWLTNILGFLLLHWGGVGISYRGKKTVSLRQALAIAMIYSIGVVLLIHVGWLPYPATLIPAVNF